MRLDRRAICLSAGLVLAHPWLQQPSGLLGRWLGDSRCVGAHPACHDEHVVYQIDPTDRRHLEMRGSRIAGQDTVAMGALSCELSETRFEITCAIPAGTWHFSVVQDRLEGFLQLADGTVMRRVVAHRAGTVPPTATDTTGESPRAQVHRTWLRFLESAGGYYRRAAFSPSPLWLRSEQQQWRVYALALSYLPDSASYRVLGIDSVPDAPDLYRVVTLFSSDNEINAMRSRAIRLTVFAQRADTGWVLRNALPVLTKTWARDTIGPISYVIEPGYPFDARRARQAASYIDSLAGALGVPRLDHLGYYLASSSDEVYRILGLETDRRFGAVGGVAQPTNYQLFSGIPGLGEDYRHELTHVVILPLMTGVTTYLVSEGVPTWLGGTTGMDFPAAARSLAGFLRAHPGIGLDSIVEDGGRNWREQFYEAGAVLVGMVYARGGTDALKSLFEAGPTYQDLRAALSRRFARPWPDVAEEWRRQAQAFGADAHGPP